MAANLLQIRVQSEAYKIVLLQLLSVLLLSLIAFLIGGKLVGFSVLAGGLAYGLPNLIFVWRVFRFVGAHQMTQFIVAFFVGEMIKMFLSAILFLIIVKYLPVSLLSELIGFIGAIVAFWVVCVWHFSKQTISKQGVAR